MTYVLTVSLIRTLLGLALGIRTSLCLVLCIRTLLGLALDIRFYVNL